MVETNGRLNNSQRAALAKIVEKAFERRLMFQKAVMQETVIRVTDEVKKELGVTDIDEQIKCHKDMLAELSELGDYHVFDAIIKQTVRLGEAPLAGKPVTSYASRSAAAQAYRGLAQEVIDLG